MIGCYDEIQRAPQLLLAIKKTVDEDCRLGRFLLTGSANLMALPTVADSLAGRMETLTLLTLSQSEIQGTTINWLDEAFAGRLLSIFAPLVGGVLVEAVLRGGYPKAISRTTHRRRAPLGADNILMRLFNAMCVMWLSKRRQRSIYAGSHSLRWH